MLCRYDYILNDYQNNVRAVIGQSGALEEVNGYYPYGGITGAPATGVQPLKYGGKELDRENGLDWLDSQARMYDFIIGRTPTMDPMSEKYYHLSPYLWCAGNPLRFIDLTGKEYGDHFRTANAAAKDFGKIYNALSIMDDRERGAIIYKVMKGKSSYYTYTKPNIGTSHKVVIEATVSYPEFAKVEVIADIHTHGAMSEGYNDNEFSGAKETPEGNLSSTSNDIGKNNAEHIDGYLATPNGTLKKYNHKSGEITIICTDMPYDSSYYDENGNLIDNKTNEY